MLQRQFTHVDNQRQHLHHSFIVGARPISKRQFAPVNQHYIRNANIALNDANNENRFETTNRQHFAQPDQNQKVPVFGANFSPRLQAAQQQQQQLYLQYAQQYVQPQPPTQYHDYMSKGNAQQKQRIKAAVNLPEDYAYGKRTNIYDGNPKNVELPLWDRKASIHSQLRDTAHNTINQRIRSPQINAQDVYHNAQNIDFKTIPQSIQNNQNRLQQDKQRQNTQFERLQLSAINALPSQYSEYRSKSITTDFEDEFGRQGSSETMYQRH